MAGYAQPERDGGHINAALYQLARTSWYNHFCDDGLAVFSARTRNLGDISRAPYLQEPAFKLVWRCWAARAPRRENGDQEWTLVQAALPY